MLILSISIKNLYIALFTGSVFLGIYNLSIDKTLSVAINTLTDPSIFLLAVSVGLIAIIGGLLQESHLMESLIQNFRVGKKGSLILSPALFGMLPMPGGALLSAPMVDRFGEDIDYTKKAIINVWFRHFLVFIYPLGALLPTTKMAGLELYNQILYLLPLFLVIFLIGFFFFIHNIDGKIQHKNKFSLKGLLIPLSLIMIAPVIHFSLINYFTLSEIPLILGVSICLISIKIATKLSFNRIFRTAIKVRFWKFTLIIFGMFLFLNMFIAANIASVIANAAFTPAFLLVGIGSILGFVTGRIQLPVSIIIPIYFAKYSTGYISPISFAIMYFSVFMGYVASPIHPCVSVSIEYFKTNLKNFMQQIILPTLIALIIITIIAIITLY
ncbi:MAG: DUF401 family protein [bacterium]